MILVTGGTGFLGRHVVDLVRQRGEKVRLLVRRPIPDPTIALPGVDYARGDVVDSSNLDHAFSHVKSVIHMAGKVDRAPGGSDDLYQVHVDGTRNVLRAAAKHGVQKFVHVSTSGTIAVSDSPEPIADEKSDYAFQSAQKWPYYLSKIYAERLALEAATIGISQEPGGARTKVPVTVISPSWILGPGDDGFSSSGELVRFVKGEIVALPTGGVNFVDVRDAAASVVAGLDKGRAGERYLVGGANMTVEAFALLLEKVSGVAAPTLAIPSGMQDAAARALKGLEGLLDAWDSKKATRPSRVGEDAAALALGSKFWYLDAQKARNELGFSARPPETTLRETVDWLLSKGSLPTTQGVVARVVRGFQNRAQRTRR